MVNAQDRRRLLQHLLKLSPESYARNHPIPLTTEQQSAYDALLQRRASGEPVAKIIGQKSFWKSEFITNGHTLDPRPESEHIIEAVLAHRPDITAPYTILDCGTGTGCLLLSLLQEYPNAKGTGIDISADAIDVATQNAQALEMESRICFERISWTSLENRLYDIVVSNPPYIPTHEIAGLETDVRDYDPHTALDGGEDGLTAYKQLFARMDTILAPDGLLVCESGIGQASAIIALASSARLKHVETRNDIAQIPRSIVLQHA